MEKKDWDLTGEVREMAKKAQLHEICNKEPWSLSGNHRISVVSFCFQPSALGELPKAQRTVG